MGIIQSLICSIMFCVERVLTWVCFAFVLIFLMGMMLVLMVYGISVGYHYAQKELAAFAMTSRTTTVGPGGGGGRRAGDESRPVVRLVAVNKSSIDNAPRPLLEVYQNRAPPEKIILEAPPTPVILLETESPPPQPALLPHERDLAKKLIGRFRRSKNVTMVPTITDTTPFLRPFKVTTRSEQITEMAKDIARGVA